MCGDKRPNPLTEAQGFWQVFGASVIGAAHRRAGKPCQDAIRYVQKNRFAVLTIADGHGSVKSPHSDKGAQIAVEVAIDLLVGLYSSLGSSPHLLKRYAEEQLLRKFVHEWTDRVKERHHQDFGDDASKELLVLYGSTLLAALLARDFLLFLQLGDGDILVVSDDGRVMRPIPKDERLIANETTSLSTPQAWQEMQIDFWPVSGEPPPLVLLSTDGYANSFVSEQDFLTVGRDYLELIRKKGIEEIKAHLEEWLEEASIQGSGDDITVGLAFWMASQEKEKE